MRHLWSAASGAKCLLELVPLGLIALTSCGGLPRSAPEGVPDWVWNVPYDDEYFYGRGSYAHSLYQEDNEKNARAEALTSLARQIRTRVKDLLVMRGTSDAASTDRLTRLVADNVVEGAQHVATWTDWDGVVRVDGRDGGRVWVLLRLEKERVLAAAEATAP